MSERANYEIVMYGGEDDTVMGLDLTETECEAIKGATSLSVWLRGVDHETGKYVSVLVTESDHFSIYA